MPFPTTGLIDDFNRADSGTLGSNYTNYRGGSSTFSISSNAVAVPVGTGVEIASAYNVNTYGADSEAYFTLSAVPANSNSSVGIELRLTTLVVSTIDGYHLDLVKDGTTGAILRLDNGAYTQLGAAIAITLTAGNRYGLEMIGSTLKAYRDTGGGFAQVGTSRTDTTYAAAGYLAIQAYLAQANETPKLDDFSGGTVALTVWPLPGYVLSQAVNRAAVY